MNRKDRGKITSLGAMPGQIWLRAFLSLSHPSVQNIVRDKIVWGALSGYASCVNVNT